MAGALETFTVRGAAGFPAATLLAPIGSSSVCALSGNRKSVRLPVIRGLKIQAAYTVASVTDATWQSLVLESVSPVLVEFWAPWCGPCRMIHPVIDELAKQYTGKLKCYKVNTDESPSIATRYGIRSIPTVMIFKDGDKKDTVIGAVPKSTLTTSIEKFL
ncbi:hypothetical protein C3L33_09976, partial [Rhododendron williamsianum]